MLYKHVLKVTHLRQFQALLSFTGSACALNLDSEMTCSKEIEVKFDPMCDNIKEDKVEEPEPVDWEYYRKGIGSRLVDMYKEAYDSIEIPKYVDTVTPQYTPKFDSLLVELKEAEQKSLKESERLEKEIADVQELKMKLSTMTADEYFAKHPELKKKFDDEIRNDYWGY